MGLSTVLLLQNDEEANNFQILFFLITPLSQEHNLLGKLSAMLTIQVVTAGRS